MGWLENFCRKKKKDIAINGNVDYNTGMSNETAIIARQNGPSSLDLPRDSAARLVVAFLAGRTERTLKAYRQDLEGFRGFVGAEDLNAAAASLIGQGQGRANELALAYKADLRERGLSPATINRRLAALRSMVKMARTLGLVPWTLDVDNAKTHPYRDTRGPGLDGFCRILEAVEGRHAKAARDRAILRLLFDLALRRAEVVGLDVADVDLEAGTVCILGKGRAESETLSLPAKTIEALRDWLEVHPIKEGPLFVNFDRAGKGQGRLTGTGLYMMVRRYARAVGIKTRPHGLRHASITEAVKLAQVNGYGLEEVLDFSRHANVKTLLVYRDRERNLQGKLAELVSAGT